MNKLLCVLTLTIVAMPGLVLAQDDDLAVVINKANSSANLTKSQLRKLVLGEQASWPGGMKVMVVLGESGTAEREGILHSICRMSNSDFQEYLKHADFSSGNGATLKLASSAASARQLVAGTPGAIGFLRPGDVDDSVKAVSVDGQALGAGGYPVKYTAAGDSGLRISELDAQNAATQKVSPVYPALARQLRLAGKVVVEAVVSEAGTVEKVKTVNGNPILANSALEAVKKWKFKPFQANGKASMAVVTLSFDFTK